MIRPVFSALRRSPAAAVVRGRAAVCLAALASAILASSGCGTKAGAAVGSLFGFQKKNVLFDPSETQFASLDSMAASDFGKVDALTAQRELDSAEAFLDNMPLALRDTGAWHFRKAVLATLREDYAQAKGHMLKAQVGGAYPKEFSYLAAFLELADGEPIRAAEICLDLLDRDGRDRKAWLYMLHAAADHPRHPGIQQALGHLKSRYQRLPEVRALEGIIQFAHGETARGLEWMKELSRKRPNDFVLRRLHLDALRNLGRWKEFGREARQLLSELSEDHPERQALQEELDSLLLAARQRELDPVPPSIAFNTAETPSYEAFLSLIPARVPLNERDPLDNMPKDTLDDETRDPLYYLPYMANTLSCVGVRRDAKPMYRAPEMENPETDYRPRYSIDFLLPRHTRVLAARGGVVSRVKVFQVNDADEFERVIEIAHRDGTIARYWHLQRFEGAVQAGQLVYRGQPIGSVGETGHTHHQHLRFEVGERVETGWLYWLFGWSDWWEPYADFKTVPVHFADVAEPDGVPREGRWYRSRNVFVPPFY